jgi:hypothetical protein
MVNHYILLESDVLKTIVNTQDKVIVMFGSIYCAWCRQILKDSLNDLAIENRDSILVYIDAENAKGGWNFPRSMRLLPKEPDQWPWWACFNKGQCIDTITTSAIWEVKEWLNKQN